MSHQYDQYFERAKTLCDALEKRGVEGYLISWEHPGYIAFLPKGGHWLYDRGWVTVMPEWEYGEGVSVEVVFMDGSVSCDRLLTDRSRETWWDVEEVVKASLAYVERVEAEVALADSAVSAAPV